MGVKCGRQMNCCLEVDLSHKSNNNIQDPYNQNTQRFLNDKNIITKKKDSIYNVNAFAKKFMKLEAKMFRNSIKNISNITPPIISNALKFNNEIDQLTIIKNAKKNESDINMIYNIFSKNYFLKSLNNKDKEDIISEIHLAKITSNRLIIKEGFPGRFFYIIRKGLVEVIKNNIVLKQLNKGEGFGEFALLNNSPRTCSIKSIIQCEFWILERESFRRIINSSTIENYKENKKFIQSIKFLQVLENYQISILCFALYKGLFTKGQVIANEGDFANCIYIIKEGEVNFIKDGKIIRTLKEGENFGERSIFLDPKRSLDIIAKTDCICYTISFDILKVVLGFSYKNALLTQMIKMSFSKSEFFNKINSNYIDKISHLFTMKNYNKNDIVYKKGTYLSDTLCVIIDGNLINSNKEIIGKRGEILFDNNSFNQGNDALIYDLIAYPDCLICEAETNEILKFLHIKNFKELINRSNEINILSHSELLRKFHFDKIEEVLSKMERQKYKQDDIIVTKGKEGKYIFFIKEGTVMKLNQSNNLSFHMNNYESQDLGISSTIGENLLFNNSYNDTIIACSNCELLYINKSTFIETLGEKLISYLKNCILLKNNKNLTLRDFDFYGHFNIHFNPIVSLIKSKTNDQFYVIKSYIKESIINKTTFMELKYLKEILLKIDYPFISTYIKTIQDINYLYFLFEYIPGISLNDLISNNQHHQFSTSQLQFYFSNLLLIINHLHQKSIIHRSIQPTNIIINTNGYLNLIDLKTSKQIEDRTNSIIGNIYYMAPEVIMGEGYSFEIDYWSVAVIMYQISVGYLPFDGNEDDPMSVYFSIINGKVNFPYDFKDVSLMSLLCNMLEKSPYKRFSRMELIQGHSWFSNFNFKDVEYLKINPEFIPKVENINYQNNEGFNKISLQIYKEWKKSEGGNLEESDIQVFEELFEDF